MVEKQFYNSVLIHRFMLWHGKIYPLKNKRFYIYARIQGKEPSCEISF